MSLQRILPACLLLLTAFGTTWSARADQFGAMNGLVARLHGQANAVQAQIRTGFQRSNHYPQLNQAAAILDQQTDQLRAGLRSGIAPQQLRVEALQADQAIVQLDQLVEHVEQDIQRGACNLLVNPEVVHRQIHQMRGLSQELLSYLPAQQINFRPNFGGGGFGGGGFGGNGFGGGGFSGNGFGGNGFGSGGLYGNGFGGSSCQPNLNGYGSGYGVAPQPGLAIGGGNGGFYIGGRNWGVQFGR